MEILSKISRPSPAELYPRTRLFHRLDQARRPVIFINGPPGSGKTSLVTSYISARKLPCLWYQIDVTDEDVASFFYHMGIAATRVTRGRRRSLPLLTPEYLMGVRTFAIRFFSGLYSKVLNKGRTERKETGKGRSEKGRTSPRSRFVIVLDNYQDVAEESLLQPVIRDGLSAAPADISVIIISRNGPPPVFAEMQANRLMEVIGWEELKLQVEETKGIVHLLRNKSLPEDVLLEMQKKTEGWAAGLVLLAEQAGAGEAETLLQGSHSLSEIFDYFAGVILEKTEADIRAFLEKTAFFRKFTPDMARELTRNTLASRILSDLNRNNYFTRRLASRIPVYEYHNLFREFLLARTEESLAAEDLSRIRCNAAVVCEAHGQVEDAMDLFLQERAWEDATRLILRLAPELVSQGRGMTLSRWIKAIPQENPYLLYWKGICQLRFSPSGGRESIERAFQLFEAEQNAEGSYLAWSAIVNSYMSEWDDFTPLDPWIEWLDKRLSDGPTPPHPVYGRVAVSMIWALTYRRPWHPDIRTWADRAMSLSLHDPDPNLRVQARIVVSTYNYFMGEEAQGVLPAKEGRSIARQAGISPLTVLGMKFIEIILHWLTAAPGSSGRLISEGLAIAEKTGVHIYDSMLYSYAVCDFLTRGELAEAGQLLKKMESMLGGSQRSARGHYHYVSAWYHLLLKDVHAAAIHAEMGVQIPSEMGMPFGEASGRILLAYLLQAKGETGNAFEQIEAAREIGLRAKSSLFEWLCDLAEAWVSFNAGREAFGLKALRRAMAIGRAKGFMNYEGWLPSVMTYLCRKALDSGIEVDYARTLIRKRGLIPDNLAYECESWPWSLKIHTLGRFGIMRDEKPLKYPVRAPRVPLTLLKTIIASGSGGVKEDQLIDALWPEADGDMAHQTFKTTLHRLRQLLGDERAIQVREGRAVLDRRCCWVDAYAFEHLIARAESLWRKDHSNGAAMLVERALTLYRGIFLGEEASEPWAIVYQERLRSKFIRALDRLGAHYEKEGRWEKAVECYKRGLEADELAEEFYQRLMASYLSSGRKAEAVAVYNRCRKIFQSALGIGPSPKTEKIFKSLKE